LLLVLLPFVVVSAATATGSTAPLSATSLGVVEAPDGSGVVALRMRGAEPATAPWVFQPVSGSFRYVGRTSFNGIGAVVDIRIVTPSHIAALCTPIGNQGWPTTTFNSTQPDGGTLLVRALDGRVLVDTDTYVKVYLVDVAGGPDRITMSTEATGTMWLDHAPIFGPSWITGIAGWGCGGGGPSQPPPT
jgi:hypothetical protein